MYEQELEFAMLAATQAGAIIKHNYQRQIPISYKSDDSPVTQADTQAEAAIRQVLAQKFPSYGFVGEETGGEIDQDGFTWLVDPLDGTKSFVRGYPFLSTQIALMHAGEIVVGVSSAPIFEEIAYAIQGRGAWLNGKRLCVSDVNQLERATLSSGNVGSLAVSQSWLRYGKLLNTCNRTRGYGDFYHYHLLAAGKIDVVIESDLNILDIAALSLIVNEAGGKCTDLAGQPICASTTSVLAANARLHARVLSWLSWQG